MLQLRWPAYCNMVAVMAAAQGGERRKAAEMLGEVLGLTADRVLSLVESFGGGRDELPRHLLDSAL